MQPRSRGERPPHRRPDTQLTGAHGISLTHERRMRAASAAGEATATVRGTRDRVAPFPPAELDRVAERHRAAALARHYRDAEQLSIAEIARRLGRAPATIKAYLYDPTGEKAKAVKARYRGYCRSCGAGTSPRNGKGDAYLYCWRCRPGAAHRKWTRERVGEAMR